MTKAAGQNLARWLMEMPSNHMTPTIFARNAVELLTAAGVTVAGKLSGALLPFLLTLVAYYRVNFIFLTY